METVRSSQTTRDWWKESLGKSVNAFLLLTIGAMLMAFAVFVHENYPFAADVIVTLVVVYLAASTILKIKELVDAFRKK